MKQQFLSLGKDSLIYGFGSVITRFIGLLTLPLFTAYLMPQEYGILTMLTVLVMLAQPIFSLGLGAAMGPCYFERENIYNKSNVVWTTFFIHTLSSALLIIIGWSFPELIEKLVRIPSNQNVSIGLTLTGCAFTIMATSLTARVQFEKQAKLYVAVTLITALIAILVSLLTVVFLGWGVNGMVIGQLSGNVITLSAFTFIALRHTKLFVSAATAKELLRQGLPLVPSFAFIFIIMHGNKYILEWNLGLDAVGVYSIGFNLGMTITIVTAGISPAWFPFFLKYINRQSEAKKIFSKILTYYVFSGGILTFYYAIFAKIIVLLLTTEAYQGAYHLIGFVALAYFFQTLFVFFLPGLYFNKEVKYVSVVQGIAAALSLPVNYYSIVKLGVFGAAVGLAVSNIVMVVLLYGWNIVNKSRYPCINYEWRRMFGFLALTCFLCFMNEFIQVKTLLLEILKSTSIALLATISTFQLLTYNEKEYFLNRFIFSKAS